MKNTKIIGIFVIALSCLLTMNFKTSKDELVFGTVADVVGLSPILTNDSQSAGVNDQIYETLFIRDDKNFDKILPLLAESYETPDNKTWIFKLRKGVKFHDGTPFNAEAVKFTFERIVDPKTASPRASILKPMESIRVINDYTVELKTKAPYGAMLAALSHTNTAIVSPAAVKKYGSVMQNPVGTGPFKFVNRVPGNKVELTRNDDYWRAPAKLKSMVFRVIPEVSSLIAMLETGEVDFMLNVPPEHIARLKANPDVSTVVRPGTRINYLGFNFQQKPLDNLKVRQAIAYAVDRDMYIETLNGLGIKSNGIIGPMVFGYDKSIEKEGYEYNPEKAKKLLAEAGYPNGLKIELYTSNRPLYMNMAEVIQSQLLEVGIDTPLNVMDWGAFLGATSKHQQALYLLGWSNLTADGSELVYPNLHPDNVNGANRSYYTNQEIGKLITDSRSTTDQAKRLEILKIVNKMLVDDVAMIPMAHQAIAYAHNNKVKDLVVHPNEAWFVYTAYKQ